MKSKDVSYFTQRAIHERAMAREAKDAFWRQMHERFAVCYESELGVARRSGAKGPDDQPRRACRNERIGE